MRRPTTHAAAVPCYALLGGSGRRERGAHAGERTSLGGIGRGRDEGEGARGPCSAAAGERERRKKGHALEEKGEA